MKLPELFRTYLLSKKQLSGVTANNYASDIRKFMRWFEESFRKPFQSRDLSLDIITLFQKTGGETITADTLGTLPISPRSFERYFSSLRKFAAFLSEEGYIDKNPFDRLTANSQQPIAKQDPWFLKDFKDYLYVYGASNLTIKNYVVDINAFTGWLEDTLKIDRNVSKAYIANITPEIIDEYKQMLIYSLKLSPKTVNRKLSSIRKYLEFSKAHGYIQEQLITSNLKPKTRMGLKLQDIDEKPLASHLSPLTYSRMPPVRLFQRLLTPYVLFEDFIAERLAQFIKNKKLLRKALRARGLSGPAAGISENQLLIRENLRNIPIHIPWHKKLIHHAKYTRPNWYKRYHSYTFAHYFHLAILIIYASAVGFMLYSNLFAEPRQKALAGPVAPKRVLSFQGRLTDTNDNPITTATDIRFGIYESETATGSALLWQEVHSAVTPDSDGIFSILLGTKNGIQSSVFRDHDLLWLGITIGKTPELTPRQRLAAVAYAANSESLQGMLPITDSAASTTNVVLALDSSGNLTIAGTAAPTFAATGGRFRLSGTTLLLSTQASSNGDVDISPDGTGKIDVHKPIINDTATGNLIGGAVEINDKVAILATESAVAAFVLNNNTTGGDIFTASSSGTTRFTIANDGDLTLNGGDTVSASSLATFTTAATLAFSGDITISGNDITNTTLNLGGGSTATIGTVSDDNLTITPNGSGTLILTSDFNTAVLVGSSSNTAAPLSISGGIGSNAAFIINQTNSGDIFTASASGTTRFILGNAGTLTLSSGVTQSNTGQYLCVNTTSFEVGRNNTACSASSARFKENINDLSYGLSDVLNLHPVTFTFKPEMNMGSDLQVGFIAEEVEKVIPELVSYDSQGRPSGVNYPNMTALLTRAIQELAQKLEATSDSVTIAGQSLRDYILDVVSSSEFGVRSSEIISPLASIDRINTNIISPLAGDTVTISGNLEMDTLKTRDATISGTLYANNIKASSIEGLEDIINQKTASNEADLVRPADSLNDWPVNLDASLPENGEIVKSDSESMEMSGVEPDRHGLTDQSSEPAIPMQDSAYQESGTSSTASGALDALGTFGTLTLDFVDISNLSADFATFRVGLISLGPATLTQATILDSLSIGTSLMIGPNSIDTLGQTLEIQPLKQGAISFMAGAVQIETDGTLKVLNDAEFASNVKIQGSLSTDLISPLANKPVVIASGSEAVSTNSALLDIQGSASISGALTSRKLNLAFAEQAFATSDIEAVATGSAGFALLKQYRNEITIKNPNVTEKSLIYITPVGNTNNKVLYLLRQTPNQQIQNGPALSDSEGSFTVGVNTASTVTDIKFNWIIVN